MPDFDKLDSVAYNKTDSIPDIPLTGGKNPEHYINLDILNPRPYTKRSQIGKRNEDSIYGTDPYKEIELLPTVTAKQLYENRRYPIFNADTVNPEDQYANAQSGLEQAYKGILKGANLAGTTMLGGFGVLGGAALWAFSPEGKMSDLWDNQYMRALDEYNNEVDQNYLPNYYTNKETNAKWYERDNWFTANFLFDKLIKNSGYAVGAAYSGNIFQTGLNVITKGIAAGALAGAKAIEGGAKVAKVAGIAMEGIDTASKFKAFAPLLKNTARAFSQGKNIEVATALEGEIKSITDVVLKTSKLKQLQAQTNAFTQVADYTRRLAVAGYSMSGESAFEALQTADEFRNNLIENYKNNNNGLDPSGEDLENINNKANEVGKSSFMANLAILSVTEFFQLPKQLGSTYKSNKQAANSLFGEINETMFKDGKYLEKLPKTKFGKIYKNTKRLGGYMFDPKEGVQEVLQYATQIGTQNYYKKAFEGKDVSLWTDGFLYGMFGQNEEGKDVGALVSKEGIEGGILGGITGGVMSSLGKNGNIAQDKKRTTNTQKFINLINNAPSYKEAFLYKLKAGNKSSEINKDYEESIIQGDKLEALDLKADGLHAYLSPRVKYGRLDMVLEDTADFKKQAMSAEGLASLKEEGFASKDDTAQTFTKKIEEIEKFAKDLNESMQNINFTYSGIVLTDLEGNPVLNSKGELQKKYSSNVLDKLAYVVTKIKDYDTRIPQLNSKLTKEGINTYSIVEEILESGDVTSDLFNTTYNSIKKMEGVTEDVKDELKTDLIDLAELALRKKYFIEEFKDIKNSPEKYEEDEFNYTNTKAKKTSPILKFVNSNKEEENLVLNKEYSLQKQKESKIKETKEGTFELTYPDGKIISFDTEKEAVKVKKDVDEFYNNLSKIKVLKFNNNNTVKIINNAGEVTNVPVETLTGYERIQSQEEKLEKDTEDLNKQLEEFQEKANNIDTVFDNQQIIGSTDNRKDASILFTSTTSPSEDTAGNFANFQAHIKRARNFINNFKFFNKKAEYRVIIVTPNNAKELGLDGIAQISYGKTPTDSLTQAEQDTEQGFMAQVLIIKNSKGDFFVDETGKIISKVGKTSPELLEKVVFQTMPSASRFTSGGYDKYRQGQEAEAATALEAYKIFRKEIFKNKGYTSYSFNISRGISNQNKINGVKENNAVEVLLGENSEKIIQSQEGLIEIVTSGKIEHSGELLNFPSGTALIKYGDLLDFVNNKKVTNKQANVIFALINRISNEIIELSNNNKPVKINYNYSTFLLNTLFWRFKGDVKTSNQIGIDTVDKSFIIGDKTFPLSEIQNNKEEIVSLLQNLFFSVNNKTLTKEFTKSFTEYKLDNSGELQIVKWKNYQTYLLSSKNPDGTNRNIEDIPLITHTAQQTDNSSSYKQKYLFITDRDVLPYDKVVKKEEPVIQQAPVTEISEDSKKELTTLYKQKVKDALENLKIKTTKVGETVFSVKGAKYKVISVDANGVATKIEDEFLGMELDPSVAYTKDPSQIVNNFVSELNSEIEKLSQQPVATNATFTPTTPYGTVVGEQITTSTQSIEEKKADIERRRQEELETTKNIGDDKLKEGRENTKKIVESLKQRYPATSVQGIIIRILEKLIDFNKYSTIIDSDYLDNRKASGQATWFGMIISQETLDGILAGKEFEIHTFIHEFIHGFTTSKISGYNIEKQGLIPGFKSKLTSKEKNAIEQLQRIFEKVKRDNPKSKEYGFTNLDEFIAEAFSNSSFQYTLKNTKAEGKKSNLFSEFINAIGDLLFEQLERWAKRFNKEIPQRDTITGILEDVLAWAEELIDQNNKLAYIATNEEINAKYDAELKVLEEQVKIFSSKNIKENVEITEEEKPYDASKIINKRRRGSEFRLVGINDFEKMTSEEEEIFKQWHAENVPNIPFEILQKTITTYDNKEAHGVFEEGVVKFVKGGLKGTEYHEVFEAIWADFLTEQEKQNILEEFKNTNGVFKDRETGKEYANSDPYVSDKMIKERIADNFADFRIGKLPARNLSEAIRIFFNNIIEFFKSFAVKPSLQKDLFKAINKGKFKEYKLSGKAYSPEYRAIEGLTEQQTNEYVQDIIAQIKMIIFGEGQKELLFNPEKMTTEEIISKVKDSYIDTGDYEALGENRFNNLIKRASELLRTFGVSIEVDNIVSINDENANSKEYASDPFSTDWKKYSTGALKFLLSTMTEREPLIQTNISKGTSLVIPEEKLSNVGYKLLNFNRVFATLLDKLHNTTDVNKFTEKLIQLAKEDSNYLPLFSALGGNRETHSFPFNTFKQYDWDLFIQFYNTFSRQKPEALIQYTSEDGEVYTGSANLFTPIEQTVNDWINNMKVIGKSETGLISYNKKEKIYVINSELLNSINIKKVENQINFLSKIGIEFNQGTYNALSNEKILIKGKITSEVKQFADAVADIQKYLGKNNNLMTFDAKRLDISGPLRTLATLHTKINNPNQDSTYFGVEDQRISSFAENNISSYFENSFNESETLEELFEKMPHLKDVFSKGSVILKKGGMFFDEEGNRIAELHVEYIQGNKNAISNKNISTSKLDLGERHIQEINQNISGKYYVLLPGDSSTEWMMTLNNVILMDDVIVGEHINKINNIYNNYLLDEINLALENRTKNLHTKNVAQKLRFFKDILSENIVNDIEALIKKNTSIAKIKEYINTNQKNINDSFQLFINDKATATFNILSENRKIIQLSEDEYSIEGITSEFAKKYNLNSSITKNELFNFLTFINVNYQINNIEYHKILFGDPYQFKTDKGKLDETKRIKSFLSPRRRIFNHKDYNNFLNEKYNNINGIELKENTPGFHTYKNHINTVTFANVTIVGSLALNENSSKETKEAFSEVDETDAFSWIMDNTYKEKSLKEAKWSKEAEQFHQWHMAYTRQAFAKKNILEFKYDSESLESLDAELVKSSIPKHKIEVLKPIITGSKHNSSKIDLVLDKTAQMPLYYHMVEGTSLEKMYIQMFKEQSGYGIVLSGRKVGTEEVHSMYKEGVYNAEDFKGVVEVPWSIYGTQVETMSEGEKQVTKGSQLPQIATMDLFENGQPISKEAELAYNRFKNAEENYLINAYNSLLKRLGIEDNGVEFTLENNIKVSEALVYEMLRRDVSENTKDSIQINKETGEFLIPLESSPSYKQIKSILYSLINNALISPKMNGAPYVQTPVTGYENNLEGRGFAQKIDGKWKKITKAQFKSLSEEEKAKVAITSDTLSFYKNEDGNRVMEIMLPNWFANSLKRGKLANYTDDALINYLNLTEEGRKILTGVAFRIPTQALSSAEVFKVKKFLPAYMGYTVVVPSEITKKAGSDFDIDKLNIYLKSIYVNKNGDIKLIKYKGSENATKQYLNELFDNEEFLTKFQQKELQKYLNSSKTDVITNSLLISIFGDDAIFDKEDIKNDFIQTLVDQGIKETVVDNLYKKALENEYYSSLEDLITLPSNYTRLISPVDDAGLIAISENLDEARGFDETKIKGGLLDRNYMTNLRHAFITGKRWIGIAAVNITNLSLRQKSQVYLNPDKISLLSKQEKSYVKDLSIVLPHNTISVNGENYVSLSGTKTFDGSQFISDRLSGYATGFVDITANPFITKIVKSDVIVSTFMFLEAIGAGNTGIYFLNQPIIEQYIRLLDSKKSKNVLNQKAIKEIKDLFPTTEKEYKEVNISTSTFLENIKEYSLKKELSSLKNAEQHLILEEFIKYKILADQLFSYTQALNYNTTRFADSDSYLKKFYATASVNNYNLIANVNNVLENTFIGKQADLLSKVYNAYGTILKTEDPKIKSYMLSTLKRYATKKYMSKDSYEKIASLIKNAFLDYIILNDNNGFYNSLVEPLLVNNETALINELNLLKNKYPSVQLLKDFSLVTSNREKGASSIKLNVNVKDVYSENLYTGMMRELRDSEQSDLKDFYNNLINVAILQGSSQTAISIRNIIPVEDYSKRIAPIIQQLQGNSTLESFSNSVFERMNFNNKEIFTEFVPYADVPQKNENGEYPEGAFQQNPNTGEEEFVYFIPSFKYIKGVTKSSKELLKLNDMYNSFTLSSDFIKIPKIITAKNGKKVDISTYSEVTSQDYAQMKAKGDYSLFDSYYYKKVYTNQKDEFGNLIPLSKTIKIKGKDVEEFYYKQINVYGDGNKSTEFNKDFSPSIIDNGSVITKKELSDEEIARALNISFTNEKENVFLPLETSSEQILFVEKQSKLFTEEELGLNKNLNQDDFKC